jgi:hypothetical protein
VSCLTHQTLINARSHVIHEKAEKGVCLCLKFLGCSGGCSPFWAVSCWSVVLRCSLGRVFVRLGKRRGFKMETILTTLTTAKSDVDAAKVAILGILGVLAVIGIAVAVINRIRA